MLLAVTALFLYQFLFVGLYGHHFPGQRNTSQRQGLAWASEQPFAQGRLSTSSAISPLVQATC